MRIDVEKMANYAKIALTEAEIKSFDADLNAIIENIDAAWAGEKVDTSGPLLNKEKTMTLRADEVVPSPPIEEILKNAPKTAEGCFLVPQTLE